MRFETHADWDVSTADVTVLGVGIGGLGGDDVRRFTGPWRGTLRAMGTTRKVIRSIAYELRRLHRCGVRGVVQEERFRIRMDSEGIQGMGTAHWRSISKIVLPAIGGDGTFSCGYEAATRMSDE